MHVQIDKDDKGPILTLVVVGTGCAKSSRSGAVDRPCGTSDVGSPSVLAIAWVSFRTIRRPSRSI
jgi:hypothetical protein